ncbi:cryptochrome/photolyase family protein [Idiomarina tyrosinivorans]|uniref:Cryptochrome/photolyase family protein n=1 Tax=Idiomarina tyrosinivorans TaxID=1445662 RepID=A0A432ZJJ7_9GAMM|nr:cryptochrome/photolyase family protein [Idiomarina tyrosinivorans]RUO78187.1 cryptochrome/photolyase family protein [Idiomarina tyrosinivorans]
MAKSAEVHTLRLILGDQLNAQHSWFKSKDDGVLYVMMEIRQETDYVLHHQQKLLAFFTAMENFSQALRQAGHRVHYQYLTDTDNQQSIGKNLQALLGQYPNAQLQCQLADEYRVDHYLRSWAGEQNISIEWFDSEHFLTPRDALKRYFPDSDNYLMENFYRQVRRQFDILMEADKPLGGRWNFDAENRKKIAANADIPQPLLFANNAEAAAERLRKAEVKHFGAADSSALLWPVNRKQSRELLQYFCRHCLANFGRYQDTMTEQSWSLYHSRLSFALNSKMLSPLEVVNTAIEHWHDNSAINLAQIEGFVRQIIGWREFIRAMYWHHMPDYQKQNFFNHTRPLPHYFWDADTKMQCLKRAISQSLEYAYAHHIQRLMVTGNFALIAGIDPDPLDDWYLGIYIDALQWVELPNTRGMSQFADGGLLATKPYAASSNYIQKMGHYCNNCYYQQRQKVGAKACPFNSLYWHFIHRHRPALQSNHRMSMMYSVWDKKTDDERQQLLDQAERYLQQLDDL